MSLTTLIINQFFSLLRHGIHNQVPPIRYVFTRCAFYAVASRSILSLDELTTTAYATPPPHASHVSGNVLLTGEEFKMRSSSMLKILPQILL
jgi:hypothetical protein